MKELTKYTLPVAESDTVEFKTSFNDDAIVSLVAFANSRGGVVYLGVSDHAIVKGVLLGKETLAEWLNEIKNKTSPVLVPEIEVVAVEDKQVVAVSIAEYPVKPVSIKGRYYRRVGNSNHLLSVPEMINLHLVSLNSSWDYCFDPDHSLSDISLDKVKRAMTLMRRNDITITEEPLDFLFKYDLVRESKLSNAAYLLFKEKVSAVTAIELGHFQSDIIIKDSDRTKEDILSQIEQVLNFVKKHISKQVIITGQAQNTQKWQYPMDAIREIVINMIVHRDYRSSADSIVKIFNNKIEFYNPGRLPDSISIESLLANNYRSTPRNKLIADFCKDLGLIEKYGSGIRRIIQIFEQDGFPSPLFQNISEGFMVTVFSNISEDRVIDGVAERVSVHLNINQNKILKYVTERPFISSAQLSYLMGVTPSVISAGLVFLRKNGLVDKYGDGKSAQWRVIDKVVERVIDPVMDDLTDNQRYIITLMNKNPTVSTVTLSDLVGISQRKIFENIKFLKEAGFVKRIGNNKTGFWQVIKN